MQARVKRGRMAACCNSPLDPLMDRGCDTIDLRKPFDQERQDMYAATISSKYQVVIPREVREQFGLKPGLKLVFIPYKKTLRLVVVPPIEKALGIFKGMNTGQLREEVDEER
jgi:AbrB family looped-hinge helix DNA binding protein